VSDPSTPTRVLLIEDNSSDAELFRRALSKATVGRFEVDTVDRLSAAVERTARGNIDVVVLDLSLPDSFGIETLETMRLAAPGTPLVVLTGDDDERTGLEALNRGAQDYLVKGDVASRTVARSLLFAIERRLRQDQLNHRDDLLAEAQKIAAVGSFEWDLTTDGVECSDELRRIYGLEKDFAPTYEGLMERVHIDDRARVRRASRLAVTSGETFDLEYRILRAGVVRTLHARGRAIVDGSGPPRRVAGTCQDISERKKLEGELVLAGRMNSIGTLASGIAHEINNPLAYVMSNLEFIGQELRDADGAARGASPERLRGLTDAVDQACRGAERVRVVVKGLEIFARADEERRKPIALRSVVELAVNLARNEIRHRARLVKDYRQDPYVDADEARLSQVFVNLLVNAAQAIDEGQADENEIRVVVATNAAGAAVVEIGDTGCGIPEANRGQVFDPFFTTKPVGTATGLGLSIAHGVVTAHGGEISFESAASGRGVTFRVVLPSTRAAVRPDPALAGPATGAAPARRGRVLIVDDEPLIATALRRILAVEHDVTTARNGREAMERIDGGDRFDVILCDVMMPVMNGMAFYEQLSKAVPEQAERMVFITGGAFTPAAKAFLDRVSNPRVEKPFQSATIRGLIRSLVQG
jgi:PAS domain S-box-containing protein